MKYKSKIITCAFISFFMMFLLNNVIAVGNVYQAIYDYDELNKKDSYIIYRTIVRPLSKTLESEDFNTDSNFISGKSGFNKWSIGTATENSSVSWAGYKSNYLVFTKAMIGDYSEAATNDCDKAGYSRFSFKDVQKSYEADFENSSEETIDFFNDLINNSTFVSGIFVDDNKNIKIYDYSVGQKVPHITEARFANIDKYKENIIDVNTGEGGEEDYFKDFNVIGSSGVSITDLPAAPVSKDKFTLENSVRMKIKRKMLYTTDKEKAKKQPQESNNNQVYYVMDIMLNEKITEALKNYVLETGSNPYVSGIPITKASVTKTDDPITLLTPGAWLRSKVREFSPMTGWTNETTRTYDHG